MSVKVPADSPSITRFKFCHDEPLSAVFLFYLYAVSQSAIVSDLYCANAPVSAFWRFADDEICLDKISPERFFAIYSAVTPVIWAAASSFTSWSTFVATLPEAYRVIQAAPAVQKGNVIHMRTDQEIFRQILKYVGKHRKFIFLSLFAGALCSGCGVAGSELLKRVIDGLSAGTLTDIAICPVLFLHLWSKFLPLHPVCSDRIQSAYSKDLLK